MKFFLCLFIFGYIHQIFGQCDGTIDLGFLVDSSGSITDGLPEDIKYINWNSTTKFIVDVIDRFNIDNGSIRISLILFSSVSRFIIPFNNNFSKQQLTARIMGLQHLGLDTNTYQGLKMAEEEMFTVRNGDRSEADNYLIIITDGVPTKEVEKIQPQLDKLLADGVKIYSIGVTEKIDEAWLKILSSPPHRYNQNYFTSIDYDNLNVVIDPISRVSCSTTTTTTTITTTTPITTTPWTTPIINPDCGSKIDMAFVIDSSGSIRDNNPKDGSYDNWELILNFVNALIDKLDYEKVKIGVVVFSYDATMEIPFNSGLNKEDLKKRIFEIQFRNSFTNTYGGLNVARNELFTQQNGDRADADNYIILITDGMPTRNEELLADEIIEIHKNINVFAVGVTKNIDSDLLAEMSSYPHIEGRNYFKSTSFTNLQAIQNPISQSICPEVTTTTRALTTTTTTRQSECGNKMDLAFVIDSSGSIRDNNPPDGSYDNWQLILNFMNDVIDRIDFNSVNVGVVVFSYDAVMEIPLNSGLTKEELKKKIFEISHRNSFTNTYGGLNVARTELFTSTNGDRSDADNYIILITDGMPTRNEELLSDEIKKVHKTIKVFTVGVTDNVDTDLLAELSSAPHKEGLNYFKSTDFTDLNVILDPISKLSCNTPAPVDDGKCNSVIDLAFVLDASGSIGNENFEKAKDFVKSIVNDVVSVSQSNVRISLISYATQAKLHFEFSQFNNKKSELLAYIDTIKSDLGTTNTAESLKLLNQIYQNGGQAKKVAIIVTDGASDNHMDTIKETINLKRKNVHMVVISVGDWIRKDELLAMASYPIVTNYVELQHYDDLLDKSNDIVSLVCKDNNECSNNICNYGTCENLIGGYICYCQDFYNGKNCQNAVSSNKVDLQIAIDRSGSRNSDQYYYDIAALFKLIENVAGGWRIGLGSYANDAILHEYLSSDKKLLLNLINTITYTRGKTNLSGILLLIHDNVFNENYKRDNSDRKSIILLSNDGSSDNLQNSFNWAVKLRNNNVGILSYGVLDKYGNFGEDDYSPTWRAVSSLPYEKNILKLDNYNYPNLRQDIMSKILYGYSGCQNSNCQSNSQCNVLFNSYNCYCSGNYIGKYCSKSSKQFDLVLVLDVSGSVRRSHMTQIKTFFNNYLSEVVTFDSHTKTNGINVGVITFADDAQLDISIGQYKNLQDLQFAIWNNVKYRSGKTNIAKSLRIANDHFRNSARHLNKLVVLFSDGVANLEEEHTVNEANNLKNNNINIISVGVGDFVDHEKMAEIVSVKEKNILSVNRIAKLPILLNNLIELSIF
ncbi:hypothetical protein A3Q56_01412 [Intoshia linei]|uniref:Uncharacterized protein n=1 Tax=Intoshia linei TaxID=1819745 RepID=A0A177B975_9BILA|nr:hypothetical protein A3Q56_01412 [Intoshia linei]